MMVTVSVDKVGIFEKPKNSKGYGKINGRIASNTETVSVDKLIEYVVDKKYSWCPAEFYNNKRSNDTFKSKQLFALDFDSGITWTEVQERAMEYNLPILLVYETLSSINNSKFRVVFRNIGVVDDIRIANAMQYALHGIFPEADTNCKDASRLFLGGKQVIYKNESANINFFTLIQSMTEYFYDNDKAHYLRSVNAYSKATGLICKNGLIQIDIFDTRRGIDNYHKIGEIDTSPIRVYIGDVLVSPNFCIVYVENIEVHTRRNGEKVYNGVNVKSNRRLKERNIDFDMAREKCRLFKEFCDGSRWLYHNEVFGMMTNILRASGGETEFFKALNAKCNKEYYSYYETNWEFQSSYIKKQEYYAQKCNAYCPYANECTHAETMLETTKTKRNNIVVINKESEDYCSLTELEEDLYNKIIGAIERPGKRINILLSQTGSGKSRTYKEYIATCIGKQFLIAAPTNELKREILNDLLKLGAKAKATPSLKEMMSIPEYIRSHIQYLYNSGAHLEVSKYLRDLVKDKNVDISAIEYYLNEMDGLSSYDGHIVTTHARLLTFSAEQLKKYEIIVDEDIMRTLIQTATVEIDDLYAIDAALDLPRTIIIRINEVNTAKRSKNPYCTFSAVEDADIKSLYTMISEIGLGISSNLATFLSSTCGFIDSDKKTITYVNLRKLHRNVKYTILSATPCLDLYRLTHSGMGILYEECKQAKYKGSLNQYYTNSFSRTYISKNLGIYKKIKAHLGGNIPIITFKKYKDKNVIPHFGHTEGFNGYTGKDIVVVGTPHICEFIYKLVALSLGKSIDDELKHQEIEYGNYRFWCMTYKDAFLRKIQFWYIESELEQAVGRARILRQDCIVSLFSNFPLKQSNLIGDCSFLDETKEECELREDFEKAEYADSLFD